MTVRDSNTSSCSLLQMLCTRGLATCSEDTCEDTFVACERRPHVRISCEDTFVACELPHVCISCEDTFVACERPHVFISCEDTFLACERPLVCMSCEDTFVACERPLVHVHVMRRHLCSMWTSACACACHAKTRLYSMWTAACVNTCGHAAKHYIDEIILRFKLMITLFLHCIHKSNVESTQIFFQAFNVTRYKYIVLFRHIHKNNFGGGYNMYLEQIISVYGILHDFLFYVIKNCYNGFIFLHVLFQNSYWWLQRTLDNDLALVYLHCRVIRSFTVHKNLYLIMK